MNKMRDVIGRNGILGTGKSVSADSSASGVSILETNDPKSVANMIPDALKKALKDIPLELLGCSEERLVQQVGPSQVLEMLRLSFWDEYSIAVDNGRKMQINRVYGPICSREFFYREVVGNPLFLGYIIRPTLDYTFKMRELLEIGHRRFREVLHLPLHEANGRVNVPLVAEMVKIVSLVENRVRGAVVSKLQVEQRSLNVNVDAPKGYFEVSDELDDIESQIKLLEGDNGRTEIVEASGRIIGELDPSAKRITPKYSEEEEG